MNKTILLGNGSISSVALSKWSHIFIGTVLILNGVRGFPLEEYRSFDFALTVVNIVIGVYTIIYALIALTKFSGFSPKVKLSDSVFVLKSSVRKKSLILAWSEVQKIRFHSYQIDFILSDKTVEFAYRTNSKISKRVKNAIKEIAQEKNIEITGG